MTGPNEFEKLGLFYLGRQYDLDARQARGELLLYDSQDLVTHAVCVGMTGSGKTGLCLSLLEEAAIDGIAALVIDPKGDLANLLLTFPELRAADFRPWINEDDARKAGLEPDAFAERTAAQWREGLAASGQDGSRIARLAASAEFTIYTPGSTAGVPISILKSFAAPGRDVLDDAELLRDRLQGAVGSLLGLLGQVADPLQSREQILLAAILEHLWRAGQSPDLASLVGLIQQPPLSRVGAVDLESFFPADARFQLAMRINNLLASPGFGVWLEGVPLEVGQLLYTPAGRPRVAIFSIAHLDDAQRMFFVSLLLNQTLAWMRSQSGTSSLRALVYMDEVAGYFPPVANPPSKAPLLTLMKQARAFGVGIVLATQNPVDLDYKGLTNAGTWFVGRLQTERDKARLMDGLEGIAAAGSMPFDRAALEKTISSLGNRVFLLNNVHDTAPSVFQTRWALSYLRGPLTRDQIRQLMARQKTAQAPAGPASRASTAEGGGASAGSGNPANAALPAATPADGTPASTPASAAASSAAAAQPAAVPPAAVPTAAAPDPLPARLGPRPILPPDIPQLFLPANTAVPQPARLVYEPRLVGFGRVRFVDTKLPIDTARDAAAVLRFGTGPVVVDWQQAEPLGLAHADTLAQPAADAAGYGPLPAEASRARSYTAWKKAWADALYRTERLELSQCASLECVSQPDEDERDFRLRLAQVARERRDQEKLKLRERFGPKRHQLTERVRKAEQALQRESQQAQQQKVQGWLSAGAAILETMLGRKKLSSTSVRRAGTAARRIGRSFEASQDQERAEENVQVARQALEQLESDFQAAVAELESQFGHGDWALSSRVIKPRKVDVAVDLVGLAWEPFWLLPDGELATARAVITQGD